VTSRLVAVWLAGAAICAPAPAAAQAWPPPPGVLAVTVSAQRIDNTGHLLTDGTYVDSGRSLSGAVAVEVDYGITRRLSITAGVPLVFARYTDDEAPPEFIPFLPGDACRCWHHGWQDLSLTTRFNLVDTFDHVLAVTPSISAGLPTHDYDYRGEAVIGRRLKEVRLAVDAGRRLDEISPRLTVSGRYAYAIVERVLDLPNNRSNASLELAVQMRGDLIIHGGVAWQHTHGGLRMGSLPGADLVGPGEVNTPERLFEHDRILRENRTHLNIGASIRLPPATVFGTYTHFAKGTDSHAGHAVTAGITRAFAVRR
jgi:hypothetical protein